MKPGDNVLTGRVFDAADLSEYAALTGQDCGPGRVPEPLVGALFSLLLGMQLPGPGSKYLRQETRFHRPAQLGEPLEAQVTVLRVRPEKFLVDLETTCRGADGSLVATGSALIHVRDVKRHDPARG
ncbi:MAG: phosphate acetyltransferase [Xanthomonadales bacterium]|nr:phosphate acetyltransferase [Xanthomonadales bacterium]